MMAGDDARRHNEFNVNLRDLLERLEHWLQTHRPAYYKTLNPGIEPVELDRFASYVGKPLPDSFWQLYLWHNGTNGEGSFQNNRFFMPLSQVQSSHEMLTGMIGTDFEDPNWWRADWIPFLESYGGDHVCIDLGGSFRGIPGQVIEFWHDNETRPIEAPSFELWLEAFVRALEAGRWREEEGMLCGDSEPLEKELFPNYPIRAKATSE
jgi:cell wall assembly regulator SMI1